MVKNLFYLGVEGGATKSAAVLANENGRVILKKEGKALNYHAIGEKKMKENLKLLLSPFLTKRHTPASPAGRLNAGLTAVFGLAGCDTRHDWKIYDKAVKSLLPKSAKYKIVNDAEIALEAKCEGFGNGVVAIAGTGANVFGKSNKKTARAIGWDFLLGDEGGSFSAGLKAMHVAMRSWDGRIPKSVLERAVPKAAGCKNIESFYHKLYKVWRENPENIKYYIASFARLVDDAVRKNDKAATEIRDRETKNLYRGIHAVARRLNLRGKPFCVGFVGSGWKMPGLKDGVKKLVKKEFPKVRFSNNQDNSGVMGAALLARR